MREKFEFNFKADELLQAVEKKVDFHYGRQKHWEGVRAEAEKKLRDEGIDFRQVAVYGSTYTMSNRLDKYEPTFDNNLLKNFSEAQAKVKEHLEHVMEYESYKIAFSALVKRGEGGKQYILNADDVRYFGIGISENGHSDS